jgi:hypothetical protein
MNSTNNGDNSKGKPINDFSHIISEEELDSIRMNIWEALKQ